MQGNEKSEAKQLKGFYGKAKVSVKTLDILIGIGVIALIAVMAFGLQHRGYTIDFDSTGGTVVESQLKMYGETIDKPEDPTREGYTFDCWARDKDGTYPWNFNDEVSESMTLYATWQKN